MKIAFVGGVDVPAQGGIESYVFNLAKQLDTIGHDCIIICRGGKTESYNADGVRIIKEKVRENQFAILLHNIKASLKIWKEYKNIDVVNYQSIYLPFLYEWIPKLRGIKVVHTQHSFAQDNPKHSKLARLIISFLYRISAFIFSPITTVSEQNRKLIKHRLWHNSKVINCGVDLPILVEPTEMMVKKNVIKGKYYLTIGRIDPVKNLDVLVKAFLRHDKDSNNQLVIAGNSNNSYGQYLKKLAKNDKRIIFTGPVYGPDKAALLTNCMAYALVSKSEGFPIALLEAMSYGKVCLCSDIPSNKETLTEKLGLWSIVDDDISLYENMKSIESQPDRYNEIATETKKRIEDNFTWDKIATKYIEYIRMTCKK